LFFSLLGHLAIRYWALWQFATGHWHLAGIELDRTLEQSSLVTSLIRTGTT
jgi:hypothetical protein